jgi:glucose-6-phosphate dehydrogenase assembly protein OpcA
MTLIAAVDESDDPAEIGETIAMLMREHPSRAIVVRVRDSPEHYLASQVLAQCWMPFGDRRQICCEQVEIFASAVSLSDLPAVLLPLTVADLPVVLWARSMAGMNALKGIAGKVIVDSARLGGLAEVRELAKTHRVGDLAWVRLTRWRELIAQIFENKSYLAELDSLTRARLTYTGERPTASEFYLAAWLERGETIWQRGDHSVAALEYASGDVHTRVAVTGESVEVNVRGHTTHAIFPEPTDYTLLREELSIAGRDAVFETVLPKAARLAEDFR